MSSCTCRHCKPPAGPAADVRHAHEPVELPLEPRCFRVHQPDGRAQDCTLYPDGRITTVMGGEVWRSAFAFDEMCAMGWAEARIEWDPAPAAPDAEDAPWQVAPAAEELPLSAVETAPSTKYRSRPSKAPTGGLL